METNRSTARPIAAILMLALAGTLNAGNAIAQTNTIRLTADTSAVNQNISRSVERLEMLVKSSRILTLEERIPKFQVHNEGILVQHPSLKIKFKSLRRNLAPPN